jgi:DNA-binding transcriptional LysR family regulator
MPLAPRVADLASYDLLLSVARFGSIGRAAAEHGISQPAASARLALLESRIGVALLERTPRGSRLTPDGALVADWAADAIAAADVLEAAIGALRSRHQGRLRVYASMTIAEYALPAWLVAASSATISGAGVAAVALKVGNSADVTTAVLTGTADLGFIEGPDVPDGLTSRIVGRDELRLVVAPGHRWARRRSGIDPGELAATALISREQGSGTRAALERALRLHAAEPMSTMPLIAAPLVAAPLVELSSTTAIKSAVVAGLGAAVLSSLAVAPDLATGALVAVPVQGLDLTRRLRAVWPAGQTLTGPAQDLLAVALRRPVG